MKYTNILEKLLCLLNIIIKSPLDITIILIMIISLIMFLKKKISKKVCFNINIISILALILITIFKNIDILSKTYNSVVDYTFTNIYFPSVYVYLLILLIINIFSIATLINNKIDNRYKKVNKIGLLTINFIFALVLECIAIDKVDLFKKESLFANTNLVVLLELSIIIFITWLISNGIIYLSDIITRRVTNTIGNRELIKNQVNMSTITSNIDEDKILNAYNNETYIYEKNKFIPEKFMNVNQNINENEFKFIPNTNKEIIEENKFDLSSLIQEKKEPTPITNTTINKIEDTNTLNDLFSSIIGEQKVITEEKQPIDNYTLNDYRIFNKMLKDIKEHNSSNRIVIDKNLEYRLITKYSTEAYAMFKKMLKSYSN